VANWRRSTAWLALLALWTLVALAAARRDHPSGDSLRQTPATLGLIAAGVLLAVLVAAARLVEARRDWRRLRGVLTDDEALSAARAVRDCDVPGDPRVRAAAIGYAEGLVRPRVSGRLALLVATAGLGAGIGYALTAPAAWAITAGWLLVVIAAPRGARPDRQRAAAFLRLCRYVLRHRLAADLRRVRGRLAEDLRVLAAAGGARATGAAPAPGRPAGTVESIFTDWPPVL